MPLRHEIDDVGLPTGTEIEPGEGSSGGSGGTNTGTGNAASATIHAPIIIHSLITDEPNFLYFLLEWGPDDGDNNNLIKEIIPGKKVAGELEWESFPHLITNTILGSWYRFRISVINKFGWKSATAPIAGDGWVYQRAGFDIDDLSRLDEVTNILPNSDFEFDLLENGTRDLPYWEGWTGSVWERPLNGGGIADLGSYGRLTAHNLILRAGKKLRSDPIAVYTGKPYALSGYFIQDASGNANVTLRMAYYDVNDTLLEHDYVLMGEDGVRVVRSSTWPGGSIFQERDRVGSVFYPPVNVSYGRVEILNDGTSDIWADDLMLSQTNRVVKYVSWDRESIESWEDTWQYRRNIPPNGVIDWDSITPIQSYSNEDGSADIKIRWNWTEDTRKASGFVVLGNLANSGVYSPTPSLTDHDFAYKLANAAARKFDLVGVNPLNRYSFALVPYATVASGVAYADVYFYENGPNDPGSPDTLDWIDFQSSSIVDLMSAPRTQVNIIAESDTSTTLEFTVTSSNGEDTTTYYRLVASGTFSPVPEILDVPTLTVQKNTKDVTVYYYSQGDVTARAESVLEFVIDRNRVPTITSVDTEYDRTTKQGIVYWWGDDDVEVVYWDIDDGPTFITSGQSADTGWFSVLPGEAKRVDLSPRGRGQIGQEVSATIFAAPERPRVELHVVSRTDTELNVEYEAEGFGDSTVAVYSKIGDAGTFAQVAGDPPAETINRDTKDINLYYYASGTTTGLTTSIFTFMVDVDRIPEIIKSTVDMYPLTNTYYAKWWTDDDTDYVTYQIDGGLTYVVSGQAGETTAQSIDPGDRQVIELIPYGPTGSGVATSLYAFLSEGADEPPHIVVSGKTDGVDGGGAYILLDVYSYVSSGLAGSVEYAEGNSPFTDAGTSYYQHKVYRPVTGDKFSKYRAHLGTLYGDTVVYNIDQDDLPEIRASAGLSEDQEYVEIRWAGDDDVGSVEIIPSGAASRYSNLVSGEDQTDTITEGQRKNYTLVPYSGADKTGTVGPIYPLTVFRPVTGAPWITISKESENNSSVPATVTLQFDAKLTSDLYYTVSGGIKPGDAGWTSIANGGTHEFNRPAGDQTTTIRAFAAFGTDYSTVASFTIDPDEVPAINDFWFTTDYINSQATLYWSIDDDTDSVQLYKNNASVGSPITSSTTQYTASGIVPGSTYVYTAVPIRDSTEFPQFGKTVTIKSIENGNSLKSISLYYKRGTVTINNPSTFVDEIFPIGRLTLEVHAYSTQVKSFAVSMTKDGAPFSTGSPWYDMPTGETDYTLGVATSSGEADDDYTYEITVTPYDAVSAGGNDGIPLVAAVDSGDSDMITLVDEDASTTGYTGKVQRVGPGLVVDTSDGYPRISLKYTVSSGTPTGTPSDGEFWFQID